MRLRLFLRVIRATSSTDQNACPITVNNIDTNSYIYWLGVGPGAWNVNHNNQQHVGSEHQIQNLTTKQGLTDERFKKNSISIYFLLRTHVHTHLARIPRPNIPGPSPGWWVRRWSATVTVRGTIWKICCENGSRCSDSSSTRSTRSLLHAGK